MGTTSSRWMSYDTVADVYARVAVPWFTPMVHDLIDTVAPMPGERVLDLGTGTGLAAHLAMVKVTPGGSVIGVDPSMKMLERVQLTNSLVVVAAMAPGLPFAGAVFDVVVANLVLSHFPDLGEGLADVARVMRRGARLSCTAWASPVPGGPGHDGPEADAIVAAAKDQCRLDVPPPREVPVPFEDELRDRDRLLEVLGQAPLADLTVDLRRYRRSFTVEDFLSGWGSQSRYLRHAVGKRRWEAFVRRAAAALHDRFGDEIVCVNEVWIVTGRRP